MSAFGLCFFVFKALVLHWFVLMDLVGGEDAVTVIAAAAAAVDDCNRAMI